MNESGVTVLPGVYHDGDWTKDELERLSRSETVIRRGKRYRACHECLMVVRVDRWLFGSMHICRDYSGE